MVKENQFMMLNKFRFPPLICRPTQVIINERSLSFVGSEVFAMVSPLGH